MPGDLIDIVADPLQFQISLPVQERYFGLGKPVLENGCPDYFGWRQTLIAGKLSQELHLLLSHPEGVPKGAFFFFLFWWSCHCIDEQSELKAPGLFGGKRFGLTKTWLAPRNKVYF